MIRNPLQTRSSRERSGQSGEKIFESFVGVDRWIRATLHQQNIPDYMSFPDAVQLKSNPKYYYSYHRAGCADFDWVSDLFKIVNFKIVQVGHINAQGCDGEPQVIKIFKIENNNEEEGQLITKLSMVKTLNHFGDKWEFLEKYWNRNFKKFE